MPQEVNFIEFKLIHLEQFYVWVSKQNRPLSSWFLSLEEWSKMKFNEAYDKDYPKQRG